MSWTRTSLELVEGARGQVPLRGARVQHGARDRLG